MALTVAMALLCSLSFASGFSNKRPIQLRDEGTSQGDVSKLDCVGAGVSCSAASGVGTVTISGAAGAHKTFINFPVQSAKLSGDTAVRIDSGNSGATPYTQWRLLFQDGTNNTGSNVALWQGRMDDNWSGSSLTAKIDNVMISSDSTTTAGGSIKYGVSIWAITSGDAASMTTESYDTENAKTQQVSAVMSRDQTVSIPLSTIDSLAAGDWFIVKLRRDGSDSITGDSAVVSFAITE